MTTNGLLEIRQRHHQGKRWRCTQDIDDLLTLLDEALGLLESMSEHDCDTGSGYCMEHGQPEPCPFALAREFVERLRPAPKTPVKILVKIRGRSIDYAATHLYNWRYTPGGASVCSVRVSPDWETSAGLPMWEAKEASPSDVTCRKCTLWMENAPERIFLPFITLLLGVPLKVKNALSRRRRRMRTEAEYEKWERFTGQPHPGQGRDE